MCEFCKEPIPLSALRCNACDSYQNGKQCRICKEPLPEGALKCNKCGTYSSWQRYFGVSSTVLSLLVALVASLSPAITAVSNFIDRDSHTNFKLATTDDNFLYLAVWNTGHKASALLGGHLNFGSLPIDDVELDLPEADSQDAKNVIPKEDRVRIEMTVPVFQGLRKGDYIYTKEEIQKILLGPQRVTLFLNIEESNGKTTLARDTFPIERIQKFIMGRMYK